MKFNSKICSLVLSMFPCICFAAIKAGSYGEVGIGASTGLRVGGLKIL